MSGKKSLIGDDCAVLNPPPGHELLVTTDLCLEGIHFRRDWHPADAVGHRCLTRGLSDIAAMAGEPLACFLSLGLPQETPQKWVDSFFSGFLKLAKRLGVPLAGGDTAESKSGIVADVMVVGSVPRGKAVRRSGAKPGDLIYVTGELGGAAAALDVLLREGRRKSKDFNRRERRGFAEGAKKTQRDRHFYPEPRVAIARKLRGIATSMIDLSDGLSTDLAHICEESGVGAELEADAIPIARAATMLQALHGGEDYELLFTASEKKSVPREIAGAEVSWIGRVIRNPKKLIYVMNKMASGSLSEARVVAPLKPKGWEHFRG
jgi:thiamine-monophosphate kinase